MINCVTQLDIVQTIKDIYINDELIPSGTKFIWFENYYPLYLAGFSRHIVIGVTVKKINSDDLLNLPLDCLNLAED